jgi:DNA replication and repair protein RecF
MLLDDVMSELDVSRRERLVEALSDGGQSIITTTDPDQVPWSDSDSVERLAVSPGLITQQHARSADPSPTAAL